MSENRTRAGLSTPLRAGVVGAALVTVGGLVAFVAGLGTASGPGGRAGATPTPIRTEAAAGVHPSPAPTWLPIAQRPAVTDSGFGEASAFRADVSAAPLDAGSDTLVATLAGQVAGKYAGIAALNIRHYNASVFRAVAGTPRVNVAFDDCQKKGYTPRGLFDGVGHYLDVPIPATAQPATGTDGALSIYAEDTDQLWEFWKAARRPDGTWQACWGGRIDNVSSAVGQFPAPYGVSASGLAMVGLMVRIEEARSGSIDHAIGIGIPGAKKGVFRYPANRNDGYLTAPDAIPEGTRFRLDPTIDVEKLALKPIAKAVARAAQTYGFIVMDQAGGVSVLAESSKAVIAEGKADPWPVILRGEPTYTQMKGFPWDKLQVIDPNWRPPTTAGP